MGEMADYYREQDEAEFYRSNKGYPGETYEEFCDREWWRKREERVEKAMEVLDGIIRALEDGRYWVNAKQKRVPLNLLSKSYARNLIRWLESRAPTLHDHKCLRFMAMAPGHQDSVAADDFESAFAQLNEMDAKEWLDSQPLVVALRARSQRKLVRLKSLTEVQ